MVISTCIINLASVCVQNSSYTIRSISLLLLFIILNVIISLKEQHEVELLGVVNRLVSKCLLKVYYAMIFSLP